MTNVFLDHPAIPAFLNALRQTYSNGGAELVCFDLEPDANFTLFAESDNLEQLDFPNRFAIQPGVLSFAEPARHSPNFTRLREPLEDTLALLLIRGGASATSDVLPEDAEDLAFAFCEALFDDASLALTHYVAETAWHPWFYDVAWDFTWLGIDRENARVWLLVVTDTD